MFLQSILWMAGDAEKSPLGGLGGMLPILLIMVVFYFFMIRPQMRKAKDQKKYRESLSKGDKVITIGGVHGKIVDMDETTVILEMIDKARVKVERSAISMESTMALANKNGQKKEEPSDKQ
jgi:preprotein translocase subunit YajC